MCQRHSNLFWDKYVAGDISNRKDYEDALAVCPECLQDYLLVANSALAELPAGFVDSIMAKISKTDAARLNYNKRLVHYLVAACLTLVFLRLGAFDWLGSLTLSPEPGFLTKLLEGLSGAVRGLISNIGGV